MKSTPQTIYKRKKKRRPKAEDDMPDWTYRRLPGNQWQTKKHGKGHGLVPYPD